MSLLRNQSSRIIRSRERPAQPPAEQPAVAQGRRRPVRAKHVANVPNPDVSEAGSIAKIVEAQDRIPAEKRIGVDHTHVTSLLDFCARKQKLMMDRNMPLLDRVSGSDRVVWEMGRAAEKHFRTQYIAGVHYQGVYGIWKCLCKRTEVQGFARLDAPPCPVCQSQPLNYHELPMYDHDAGIVGNCDLPILSNGKFLTVEIKSMNAKDFEELEEPIMDHVFQDGSYNRLYGLNGHEVHPEGVIIYIRKDYRFGSPYKEYRVNLGARNVQTMLDLAWDDARVLQGVRGTTNSPSRVCPSSSCTRAKNCPVMVPCWS